MQELLHQLGIDWKLLLSQAVNFGLLLIVLRLVAYKPLVNLMNERRKRIEEGLTKADEADRRLHEVQNTVKEKVRAAEEEGITIIKNAEENAKATEARLLEKAHEKEALLMKEAEAKAKAKEADAEAAFRREAQDLVRKAIIKTVELSPDAVDASLVDQAIKEVVHHRS